MARTLQQWTDSLARSLRHVPEEMREAKAAELVRGIQAFQRHAPRSGKRLQAGKARGYPALYHSIKVEPKEGAITTVHPGTEILETGGIIRPLRSKFLVIPLRRAWFAMRDTELSTVPLMGGRRGVLSTGRVKRLVALLVPFVAIRGRRWITKSVTETQRGSEERIASAVLTDEVRGG